MSVRRRQPSWLGQSVIAIVILLPGLCLGASPATTDYLEARWHPLHFKPAIEDATDEQCLECHRAILEDRPRALSPAGLSAEYSVAWYQIATPYEGQQDTFHRRHLASDRLEGLMRFRCNSCHQGHDPKDEATGTHDDGPPDLTLRKSVDPDLCLMCHGRFNVDVMTGLADDWAVVRDQFEDDCLVCHDTSRTVRHQLDFLDGEAIERAGAADSDSCYGCHGGRSWYAIPYPYVRRPWLERMPEIDPEWAASRPRTYDPRFSR